MIDKLTKESKDILNGLVLEGNQGNDLFFIPLKVANPSEELNELAINLYQDILIKRDLENLEQESSDLVGQIKQKLIYVVKNDKNFLMLLFADRELKAKLKEAKEWIENNYAQIEGLIEEVKNKIEAILSKGCPNIDYRSVFEMEGQHINALVIRFSSYQVKEKDKLLLEIDAYLKSIKLILDKVDRDSLEAKIKSKIEQIKQEKGLEKVLEQSLDLLKVFGDAKLPLEKLKKA